MHKHVLAPDRVLLLLSLVPYLREHGPTPVPELAEAFGVTPELLRSLVSFLGTAGVPGETMSYQHEDLFDIDWDALELHDIVSLTRTVAVDDAPRFSPSETAALIAGLQAITGMLPDDDAELARRTAARLGAGLAAAAPAVSVTADPHDARIPALVEAIDSSGVLAFDYRDGEGRQTSRTVEPITLAQQDGAWYLEAYCRDREAERSFRVERMSNLRELDVPDRRRPTARASRPKPRDAAYDLVAVLPGHLLPRVRGFSPTVLEALPDGRVRVRIEAWHDAAAVRLVQALPGSVVVEAPAAARAAVRAWAQRALLG